MEWGIRAGFESTFIKNICPAWRVDYSATGPRSLPSSHLPEGGRTPGLPGDPAGVISARADKSGGVLGRYMPTNRITVRSV